MTDVSLDKEMVRVHFRLEQGPDALQTGASVEERGDDGDAAGDGCAVTSMLERCSYGDFVELEGSSRE